MTKICCFLRGIHFENTSVYSGIQKIFKKERFQARARYLKSGGGKGGSSTSSRAVKTEVSGETR